jgi:hypothetical protein
LPWWVFVVGIAIVVLLGVLIAHTGPKSATRPPTVAAVTTTTIGETAAAATANANTACAWEGKILNADNTAWAPTYQDAETALRYAIAAGDGNPALYRPLENDVETQAEFILGYDRAKWPSLILLAQPQQIAVEKDCKAINPNY